MREIARSVGDLQQPVLGTIAAGRSSITLSSYALALNTRERSCVLDSLDAVDALPQVEKVRGGQPRRDATRFDRSDAFPRSKLNGMGRL